MICLFDQGRCVTAGYWNNAAATAAAFSNRLTGTATPLGRACAKSSFYRTGDLGVVHNGHIYVTGRLKEMMSEQTRAVVSGKRGSPWE